MGIGKYTGFALEFEQISDSLDHEMTYCSVFLPHKDGTLLLSLSLLVRQLQAYNEINHPTDAKCEVCVIK